jgi:signal transduction histidine kinase
LRDRADTALRLERRLLAWRSSTATGVGATKQDVIESLREAVENVRQYPEISINWDLETQSFSVAGAHDLVLVFMNLFDNAIEAMQERGALTLREHAVSDPAMFVVDVSDTGRGIKWDLRERIWEPFFSDDGSGKPKGQGMGMALIRDHLENLGAYIELLDTEEGKGCTFRLTFTSTFRATA